jgi:uncharacterized cupredoxin-like copper-binding protein
MVLATTLACTPPLLAQVSQQDTNAPEMVETAFGRTGDPARITRTVQIDKRDTIRLDPAEITVRPGETVTFHVRNVGRVLLERVIGTEDELARRAELMRRNPDMEHEAPYLAHVDPGSRGEIVWQITQPASFKHGCLVAGHFAAGMVGTVRVLPRRGPL